MHQLRRRKSGRTYVPNSKVAGFLLVTSVASGLIVSSTSTPALAASSGWIYGATYGSVTLCAEATMVPTRSANGYEESNSGSSCGQGYTSPAGYFEIILYEYFNGSVCASAGPYENGFATSYWGVGGDICGDWGWGSYQGNTADAYWRQQYSDYWYAGNATSPAQNYNGPVRLSGSSSGAWPSYVANDIVGPGGVTMGPIPAADFNGQPLSLSSIPDYISVVSHDQTVGYIPATDIVGVPGTPMTQPPTSGWPVFNSGLTAVVGHLQSGSGFVPEPGTGLPASTSGGNTTTVTTTPPSQP